MCQLVNARTNDRANRLSRERLIVKALTATFVYNLMLTSLIYTKFTNTNSLFIQGWSLMHCTIHAHMETIRNIKLKKSIDAWSYAKRPTDSLVILDTENKQLSHKWFLKMPHMVLYITYWMDKCTSLWGIYMRGNTLLNGQVHIPVRHLYERQYYY